MRPQPTLARVLVVLVAATLSACIQPSSAVPQPTPAPAAAVVTSTTEPVAAPTVTVTLTWMPPARSKTSDCVSMGGLPDPGCTPGAIDPRVNQANITSTVCTRGYTATVRPPVSVTELIKRDRMAAYGLQGQRLGDYELDHLVPLELGGAPQDIANLSPEPRNGETNARMKDAVEQYLNREVCRGAMQLADAQRQIATDWLSVYRSHGLQPTP